MLCSSAFCYWQKSAMNGNIPSFVVVLLGILHVLCSLAVKFAAEFPTGIRTSVLSFHFPCFKGNGGDCSYGWVKVERKVCFSRFFVPVAAPKCSKAWRNSICGKETMDQKLLCLQNTT